LSCRLLSRLVGRVSISARDAVGGEEGKKLTRYHKIRHLSERRDTAGAEAIGDFRWTVLNVEQSAKPRTIRNIHNYPLYSFRYSGSAPAVYSSKQSEQVALSFCCTCVLHHSWKIVLFVIASARVELG